MACLVVPEDFTTQASLRFTENSPKKRKHVDAKGQRRIARLLCYFRVVQNTQHIEADELQQDGTATAKNRKLRLQFACIGHRQDGVGPTLYQQGKMLPGLMKWPVILSVKDHQDAL